MEWIKTTFGELKPGDVYTHHDEAERARDVFNFGEITVEVFDHVIPSRSMGPNRPVYRLVSPATAEREALEKIVQEYKNAVSGSVWLSDAISNVNAIATAALGTGKQVKP